MNEWSSCKNLLVVRLDNMGDVLMSVPAINALKETFHCRITLLTSSSAAGITTLIPSIDDVIIYDVSWMKSRKEKASTLEITSLIKSKLLDGAVIFTMFSQDPLPSVMLTYIAGIPLRLAYYPEKPY